MIQMELEESHAPQRPSRIVRVDDHSHFRLSIRHWRDTPTSMTSNSSTKSGESANRSCSSMPASSPIKS